jgi:hypothetical protein
MKPPERNECVCREQPDTDIYLNGKLGLKNSLPCPPPLNERENKYYYCQDY